MSRVLQVFIAAFTLTIFSSCSLNLKPHFPRTTGPHTTSAGKTFVSHAQAVTQADRLKTGRLVIVQAATSQHETYINVMVPRMKEYSYQVLSSAGEEIPVRKFETIEYAQVHYKVDKLHIKNLKVGTTYKLKVIDKFRKAETVVDERSFSALDLSRGRINFALISCMADDWRFEEIIDPMWARLRREMPDFVILNGDVVYVDSFDYVERRRATEQDLWQRYIDSFKRIPYFRQDRLIPTLATWDDHDFGTNDGDRSFINRDSARRVFKAFFGNPDIKGVYETGPGQTYSVFTGFGQKFFLMDNRSWRQPNKEQSTEEVFGHWGEVQHRWLISSLLVNTTHPVWLVNGNQFLNSKKSGSKESFEGNHPLHFRRLMEDLAKVKTPVIFASGDVHFSEIMRVPAKRGLGYDTYEITSSPMHSYAVEGWENPLRLQGAQSLEFNFLMIQSRVQEGALFATVRSVGLAEDEYFRKNLDVQKPGSNQTGSQSTAK